MRRDFSIRALLLLLACGAAPATHAFELGRMAPADLARLKARTVCSCIFVQRLSFDQCADGRAAIWRYASTEAAPPLLNANERVDISATTDGGFVRLLAANKVLAQSRYIADGGGCVTQSVDVDLSKLPRSASAPAAVDSERLPRGPVPANVDAKLVNAILDEGFSANGPISNFARAAVVVVDGKVVADRYGNGYSPHHLYYVGSIAKTLNNLLAGLLVRDGKITVDQPVAIAEWRKAGDARSQITYDHLLKMTSGLSWDEQFWVPGEPGYEVFFGGSSGADVLRYMISQPLEAPPGTHEEYSTGSASLLGSTLQAKLGANQREPVLSYLHRELLDPIGARQYVPEFDQSGNIVPGHSLFSGAEDLARIGMLWANDGQWNGKRILPAGWMEYSTRPALKDSPDYGAQLMLDMLDEKGCFGHQGVGFSFVIVCPTRDLVVVWLNSIFNFTGSVPMDAAPTLVRRLITAFPEAAQGNGP